MNPLEILQKVKEIVFAEQKQSEQKFSDYQKKDGSIVQIDELKVGGKVTVGGNPAPAGEHELADGTIIAVDEGGMIMEIKSAMPTEVEDKKEEPDPMTAFNEKFSAIEAKFTAQDAQLQQFATAHNALKASFEKQNEAVQGLVSLVERLVNEPNTQPIEPVKSGFRSHEPEDKLDKLKRLQKLFNK
jgi:hypothetical protein